jgi:hypothetical protein
MVPAFLQRLFLIGKTHRRLIAGRGLYNYIILRASSYSPSPPIVKGGARKYYRVGSLSVLCPHQCEG